MPVNFPTLIHDDDSVHHDDASFVQSEHLSLTVTCAEGLEMPLQIELASLGIDSHVASIGRLNVTATLEQMYRICLWSRVASRVLMPLGKHDLNSHDDIAEQLYGFAKTIKWTSLFGIQNSFAIRISVDKRTPVNQQFAMLRIKDAIADTFNNALGERPNVDSKQPDFAFVATVNDKQALLYLDLSGTSLHRRSYRIAMTDAPLKENLAAGLLYTVGWHTDAIDHHNTMTTQESQNTQTQDTQTQNTHIQAKTTTKTTNSHLNPPTFTALIDPMCGSGTFIIEALLMRCHYAVGLDKAEAHFGFYACDFHDSILWQRMVSEAQQRFHQRVQAFAQGELPLPNIYGFDVNAQAIKATHRNLIGAGLGDLVGLITLQQRPLSQLNHALTDAIGSGKLNHALIITNPPYGERLGGDERIDVIKPLYQGLGLRLHDLFGGHFLTNLSTSTNLSMPTLAVLASQIEQADVLPIHAPQTLRCHNGALTVYFRYGTLSCPSPLKTSPLKNNPSLCQTGLNVDSHFAQSLIGQYQKQPVKLADAQDFINRLQKNLSRRQKLASKQGITNLRIYDADLPNFKVAVDLYGNHAHVQEYAAPKSIPADTAKKRFHLALQGIRDVLQIDREHVFIKTRTRQSGNEQYSKQSNKKSKFYVIKEADAYLYANFTDYLDTGLFIDHRNMRQLVKQASHGKHLLNLFAYTCTASVHAALANAKSVTSVDLSANYLDWGKQNFALNGLDLSDDKYQFITADVFEWIKGHTSQYDVIFIDPPTFSNSKKFQGTFDVQRDHVALINRAMNRLNNDGVLYFSNNFSKFELDDSLRQRYHVNDITHQTIGFDFDNKKPIHHSYQITHKTIANPKNNKQTKTAQPVNPKRPKSKTNKSKTDKSKTDKVKQVAKMAKVE